MKSKYGRRKRIFPRLPFNILPLPPPLPVLLLLLRFKELSIFIPYTLHWTAFHFLPPIHSSTPPSIHPSFDAIFMCTICLHLNTFGASSSSFYHKVYINLCETNWQRTVLQLFLCHLHLLLPVLPRSELGSKILPAFDMKMVILCNITNDKRSNIPPQQSLLLLFLFLLLLPQQTINIFRHSLLLQPPEGNAIVVLLLLAAQSSVMGISVRGGWMAGMPLRYTTTTTTLG